MGKGDRKTKKGKLFKKSYGVSRPRKAKNAYTPEAEKTEE
jgi:ribosomal small subunit protein bTHX